MPEGGHASIRFRPRAVGPVTRLESGLEAPRPVSENGIFFETYTVLLVMNPPQTILDNNRSNNSGN